MNNYEFTVHLPSVNLINKTVTHMILLNAHSFLIIVIIALSRNHDAASDELIHLPCSRNRKRRFDDDDEHILHDGSSIYSICHGTSSLDTLGYCADIESVCDDRKISKDFILVDVPHVVKKTKEDSAALPDPFPLSTNFRPDVHVCLSTKKMTKTARAAFFTSVAASMFQFKRYPTRDDYVSVAHQILLKYPFLGSKGFGASHVRVLIF